ncbi:uncharacterized protein [Bemisia tabaci]|uniref:uncharacterized protein n=1 Tax=Bemisia tabaci TaxID=7038 RepID=UPI003B28AED7
MQKLWIEGLAWDDPLPQVLEAEWLEFYKGLPSIGLLQIERCVTLPDATSHALVGFSDASQLGYAAAVYLRSQSDNAAKVSLIGAKTRVAPCKTISIPKLELCGAQLLSTLLIHLKEQLSDVIEIHNIVAFTDSQVVLDWIKTLPCKLKTFEANRVTYILERLEPSAWKYVPSELNPSDLGSRGCFPDELVNHPMWFTGPPFLSDPIDEWPNFAETTRKKSSVVLIVINPTFWEQLIPQYSNWNKLQRVTAWILRVAQNWKRTPDNRVKSPTLSVSELRDSLTCLIKAVQSKHFAAEFKLLRQGQMPKNWGHLQPFVENDGLLRVGGRLRNTKLPECTKYPILLPKSDHLVNLLIDCFHQRYLHAGPRLLQSLLARQFWIPCARQIIRSRLSKCLPCFQVKPSNAAPLMGDLPSCRVNPTKVFLEVGLDFGGPFELKEHNRRNPRKTKGYLCLFVCMATKAVHLEVVSDLTTEAFLAALDRFVGRRGLCRTIFSDNATNFTGAKRHLSELYEFLLTQKLLIDDQLASRQIEWKFIPPSAPHFGGIWESGIAAAKYHLKRVIGEQSLTFEQLNTVFVKIEALLNSRPLCHLSSDASEIDVLTPGHFLIGAPLLAVPEYDFSDTVTNRLSRWQLTQKITQQFWKIWSRDYLHTLIQRSKWQQRQEDLKIGSAVLIADGTAPTSWKKGIVDKLHHGKDGIVRVVTVRTTRGTLKRPAVKIYPLPNQ